MKKHLDQACILVTIVCLTITFYNVWLTNQIQVIDGGHPWSNKFNNGFSCKTEDITNMYADYIKEWKKEISIAFDEAEKKVYNTKPTPNIVGPDEDPAKCPCKGTGIIVQGDGHKTLCPYHSSQLNQIKGQLKASSGKSVIIEKLK
jgi:hypothetical protein